jgi:DNA adenine methylase
MGEFSNIKFVKWAGGKGQLIDQFIPLFPKKFNRYIEPFVGSGAVLFYILQKYPDKKVIISDVNKELIITYRITKDYVEALIKKLKVHKQNHSKEYYYKIRDIDPKDLNDVDIASRFIYLNKTCFNGLYRVNSKGKFNVPMGDYKNPDVVQEDKLRLLSKLLKNATIKCESFEKVLSYAKKDDFVYLDPPYYPLNGNSFTTYHHDQFLDDAHKKLAEVFKELHKRGCFVMESNSNTEFIKKLYSPKFDTNLVKATRMINCRSEGRGIINEIVIKNY